MNFSYSALLPTSPHRAFLWLTEEEKMNKWMEGLEEFRYTKKKGASLLGAEFTQRVNTPFAPLSWNGKVTAYEQDRLLELSLRTSFFDLTIRYELSGVKETTLQKTCRLTPNLLMSAMTPMIAAYCGPMFQQQINKLTQCVEEEVNKQK